MSIQNRELANWSEIERDGNPSDNRLVVVTIVVGEGYEPEYGIGSFENGTWWHSIDPDGDETLTHWLDLNLLPPGIRVQLLSFKEYLVDRPTIGGWVITNPLQGG